MLLRSRVAGTGLAFRLPVVTRLFCFCVGFLLALSAKDGHGQAITGTEDAWKSIASGAWTATGNWSLGLVPISTHTAVFDSSSASVSPTLANTAYTLRGIVWKSGSAAYTLT